MIDKVRQALMISSMILERHGTLLVEEIHDQFGEQDGAELLDRLEKKTTEFMDSVVAEFGETSARMVNAAICSSVISVMVDHFGDQVPK